MRNIVHSSEIYPALQALLGLPDHCISFELRVSSGEPGVTVACEHYVALGVPGLKQLERTFSEYELVAREQPQPAKVENFDAWMRERTDAAHAAYMAGHAAGGVAYGAP
jgi:hypothetical protein